MMSNPGLDRLYGHHVADLTLRTRGVLAETEWDALVFHSGTPLRRSMFDDQYWPLRPVPHFEHWAHLPWPYGAIVVWTERSPQLSFCRTSDFWEGWKEPDW